MQMKKKKKRYGKVQVAYKILILIYQILHLSKTWLIAIYKVENVLKTVGKKGICKIENVLGTILKKVICNVKYDLRTIEKSNMQSRKYFRGY